MLPSVAALTRLVTAVGGVFDPSLFVLEGRRSLNPEVPSSPAVTFVAGLALVHAPMLDRPAYQSGADAYDLGATGRDGSVVAVMVFDGSGVPIDPPAGGHGFRRYNLGADGFDLGATIAANVAASKALRTNRPAVLAVGFPSSQWRYVGPLSAHALVLTFDKALARIAA